MQECKGILWNSIYCLFQVMEGYENMAGMWLVGEDMPQPTSCVTLHPTEKDQFGLPIPNIHVDDHPNDIAMRSHAYERDGTVYDAAGATRIIRVPEGLAASSGEWPRRRTNAQSVFAHEGMRIQLARIMRIFGSQEPRSSQSAKNCSPPGWVQIS
jgi:hypothetical protein